MFKIGRKIITNNKDSWELYSTITDSIVAKFETEKDLKKNIALEKVYDGKLKAIKELMTFPNGWTINDKAISLNQNEEGNENYYEWIRYIELNSETYDEYYKSIDKKLQELLN